MSEQTVSPPNFGNAMPRSNVQIAAGRGASQGAHEPDPETVAGVREAAAERARRATLADEPEPEVLSDHGRPRACPSCGGASVYASHMAMEGRACRYASKGDAIIAYYCGEHQRKHEAFDVDLHGDTRAADIGGWNVEVLGAVKGMSREVVRDVYNVRDLVRTAMGHIAEMEVELSKKQAALAASRTTAKKLRKQLAEAKKEPKMITAAGKK